MEKPFDGVNVETIVMNLYEVGPSLAPFARRSESPFCNGYDILGPGVIFDDPSRARKDSLL